MAPYAGECGENRVVEVRGSGILRSSPLEQGRGVRLLHIHHFFQIGEPALVGVKKTGRGRRKIGRKKRRMRARIRHRKK